MLSGIAQIRALFIQNSMHKLHMNAKVALIVSLAHNDKTADGLELLLQQQIDKQLSNLAEAA